MAFGDVYELIDVQTLAGQEVLNVYFYKNNTILVVPDAADLIDSFEGQVLPAIVAVQTTPVLHTELRCRNLFDPSDNAVKAISEAGVDGSDYNSNFAAVGYALNQSNGAVKNGAKRIAGLSEGAGSEGVIDEAVYIAVLTTLGAAMAGTLDVGVIATWLPIIVKRILVSAGVYRLPENSGELVDGAITEAVFNPLITSQVSRKIGVGI